LILLDTDIVIDLLRGYLPALNWLAGRTGEEIYLPGLVVMELTQPSHFAPFSVNFRK
jgi:predicted nucleic acid-binding protein